MLSKNELKYFALLKQKKFRFKYGKFLAEGKRLIEELLQSNYSVDLIITTDEFLKKNSPIVRKAKREKIRIEIAAEETLKKISDTKTPQGIIAIAKIPEENPNKISRKIIVALDRINEPGNLGTILRNCNWFGISEILLSKNSADIFNPKTLRASMGAIFHLKIKREVNLPNYLKELKLKGYRILIADIEGTNINKLKNKEKKFLLIFSNEATGPSENLIKLADRKITIPGRGNIESLNVASASAIILYELTN